MVWSNSRASMTPTLTFSKASMTLRRAPVLANSWEAIETRALMKELFELVFSLETIFLRLTWTFLVWMSERSLPVRELRISRHSSMAERASFCSSTLV